MSFGRKIIQWNRMQEVAYPWVGEKNPYRIMLSEFLLQQTRSDQATAYYARILNAFPRIHDLANANEDEVLRLWQGLGYYSRARNLHKAAKVICLEYRGQIPDTYAELLKLPGIGPYTAAAISSFAFGESEPVVDGNVYRVLSRYYRLDTPINTAPAHKEFVGLARRLLSNSDPAMFNQAIMNLGAQVCLPKNPACKECPVHAHCEAYAQETQHLYPVKKKVQPRRNRYFHYLDIRIKKKTVIEKRGKQDIWNGLYQLPLIENASLDPLTRSSLSSFMKANFGLSNFKQLASSHTHKQVLSHQVIHSRFYQLEVSASPRLEDSNFTLVFHKNLKNFALPKTITQYFESI